jgi:hypothetical protein
MERKIIRLALIGLAFIAGMAASPREAAAQSDAGCTCSGTGIDGPVTVDCGETACGTDDNTYACSAGGWSFGSSGCPSVDAGAPDAPCTCSGTGASGPVTVDCGGTACGTDYDTYACKASGWSFSSAGCASVDAGTSADSSPCTCSGVGAAGPVTVSCDETTCGTDSDTYACTAQGWTFVAAGCVTADGGAGDVGSCTCTGTTYYGTTTINCGDTVCGTDENTYTCDQSGFSQSATGCCTCSGVDMTGPVTLVCGGTACGTDGNTYGCGPQGWTFASNGCAEAGAPPRSWTPPQ